jgi:hypothetical protein
VATDPVSRSRRADRLLLLAILVVALALRLTWALVQPADEASLAKLPDQVEYLTIAHNLLAGNGLNFHDDRFKQVLYAYRMPGYPAFLAACLGNPVVARVAQAVIDSSIVLAIWLLARMVFPGRSARRGAQLAAALVAANPFLIFFAALLLSETLFAAMLAWGMVLLLAGARGGRFATEPGEYDGVGSLSPLLPPRPFLGTLLWLLGGLILAASTLVRPSAAPLAIVLGTLGSFVARPNDRAAGAFRPRWPLPVGATMLLLTAAVLTPWAYRNSWVVGQWVWTTTNAGVTAYDGFNPDATGASDQSVLTRLPQLRSMNELERSEYLAARAQRFAMENPKRAMELALAKAARTWSPIPLSAEYRDWRYWLVSFVYTVPFDLLVLLGLVRGSLRRSAKMWLLAPAVYFTLVHMASVGSLRYRVPIEPILAVLAAAGLLALRGTEMPWRRAGAEGVAE